MPATPAFIAVDWGTTSFRAYLADEAGNILDRNTAGTGILAVENGAFAQVLVKAVSGWSATLPIILSGMIGSRQGWVEAPYVRCPAPASALAGALKPIEVGGLGPIRLVPGMDVVSEDGRPDVMRGEETQILGSLGLLGIADGLFVLPGTHSKWARVAGGVIETFSTFMSGEVFAALRDHTILSRLMADEPGRGDGFSRGVADAAGMRTPGDLLNRLFGIRAQGLFGLIQPGDGADYLSGLLIGAELQAATAGIERGSDFIIVGGELLAKRYAEAANLLGLSARFAPPDCVVAGQRAIAKAAGLI